MGHYYLRDIIADQLFSLPIILGRLSLAGGVSRTARNTIHI